MTMTIIFLIYIKGSAEVLHEEGTNGALKWEI